MGQDLGEGLKIHKQSRRGLKSHGFKHNQSQTVSLSWELVVSKLDLSR